MVLTDVCLLGVRMVSVGAALLGTLGTCRREKSLRTRCGATVRNGKQCMHSVWTCHHRAMTSRVFAARCCVVIRPIYPLPPFPGALPTRRRQGQGEEEEAPEILQVQAAICQDGCPDQGEGQQLEELCVWKR